MSGITKILKKNATITPLFNMVTFNKKQITKFESTFNLNVLLVVLQWKLLPRLYHL